MSYGGVGVLDPMELHASALHQDPPAPVDAWYGQANYFRVPLGTTPGDGLILLPLSALKSLNLNNGYPLVIGDGVNGNITLKNIYVRRYQAAVAGAAEDPSQPCVVYLTDRRWLLRKKPIDKAYNVRSTPGGAFYPATRNGGADWTWQTMFADVWAIAGLGTAPALPFTPDGTPENFSFYGALAWDALGTILDRLACSLRWDAIKDSASVVRLGAADNTAANLLAGLGPSRKALLTWDEYQARPTATRLPEKVRVLFVKQPAPTDGTSPFYFIDVADTSPSAGTLAGTVVLVEDDLAAIYVGGVLNNGAALASRAAERAADWFRREKVFNAPLHRQYIGFLSDCLAAVGSTVQAVLFEDRGGFDGDGSGLRTEIIGGPDLNQKPAEVAAQAFETAVVAELKGLTFTADAANTADADPGTGKLRWNNASQNLATTLFINNQTRDLKTDTTFFAALGVQGFIYLQQADDSSRWQLWKYTSAPLAASGYYKFTVTLEAYGNAIVDGSTIYTMFDSNSASATPLVKSESFLANDKNMTLFNTWENVGLSVTLNAGTYVLYYIAHGTGQVTAFGDTAINEFWQTRLYCVDDAAPLDASLADLVVFDNSVAWRNNGGTCAGEIRHGIATMARIITIATGNKTYALQQYRSQSGTVTLSTWGSANLYGLSSYPNQRATLMGYFQLPPNIPVGIGDQLTVGSSAIVGGVDNNFLIQSSGVLGEYTPSQAGAAIGAAMGGLTGTFGG